MHELPIGNKTVVGSRSLAPLFLLGLFSIKGGKRREIEMQVKEDETGLEDKQRVALYVYEGSLLAPIAFTVK